jgi:hypothetical protein
MHGKRSIKLLKQELRKETKKAGHHRISNGMEHSAASVIHSSFI